VHGANGPEALAAQLFNSDDDDAAEQPKTSSDKVVLDVRNDSVQAKGKFSKPGKLPIFSSDEVGPGPTPQARPAGSKGNSTRQRKVVVRPSQRRPALSSFDLGDSFSRPLLAYERLIGMALLASPSHRLQAAQVPRWIHENIPGYDMHQGKWASNIKATMTLNAQGKYGKQLMTRTPWKYGDGGVNESDWYVLLPELIGKIDCWDPVNKVLILPNGQSAATVDGEKQDRPVDGLGISGIGEPIVITDDDEDGNDRGAAGVGAANADHGGQGANADHNSGDEADHHGPPAAIVSEPDAMEVGEMSKNPSDHRRETAEEEAGDLGQGRSRDSSPEITRESSTRRLNHLLSKRNRDASHEAKALRSKAASVPGSRSPNGKPSEQPNPSAVISNPRSMRKTARTTVLPVREASRPSGPSSSSMTNHPATSSSRLPPLPPPPPAKEKQNLAKSLFSTWPQYIPIDPDLRSQQIAIRPSRKQLFGKSPLHSRLGSTAAESSMLFTIPKSGSSMTTTKAGPSRPHPTINKPSVLSTIAGSTCELVDAADAHADGHNNPNDPRTWRSDATSLRHCTTPEEFFGLNHPDTTTLVPTLSGGELCFKREVDCGRRAKVLYTTGV
jgi:hypothetical protein